MAALPQLKRLLLESFQDQKDWIGRLLIPLNEFMESVTAAFANGLTFRENVLCQIKELDVSTTSQPQTFRYTLSSRPLALIKASIVEKAATPATITSAVDIDWEYTGVDIKIKNVSGLTAGKTYKLTVIVLGG